MYGADRLQTRRVLWQGLEGARRYFDSTAAREAPNTLFEKGIKKMKETEEEFMLDLVQLYSTANPEHDAAVTLLAVKSNHFRHYLYIKLTFITLLHNWTFSPMPCKLMYFGV